MADSSILYLRKLPTGGYVRIDGFESTQSEFRAQLRVERRDDSIRRFGNPPPIIAESVGSCRDDAVEKLLQIATDNVALASAILRWQATRGDEKFSGL